MVWLFWASGRVGVAGSLAAVPVAGDTGSSVTVAGCGVPVAAGPGLAGACDAGPFPVTSSAVVNVGFDAAWLPEDAGAPNGFELASGFGAEEASSNPVAGFGAADA